MNRKETTALLTDILISDRLSDRKYYAKEVTLDYGTNHPKRVDVMQFAPAGVTYASDIEKGIFTCYEIKSCYNDVYSGNGLNFYGEKNYIVTTMETYKRLQDDFRSGKFISHLKTVNPESSTHFGVLVAVPSHLDLRITDEMYAEYESPTKFGGNYRDWKFQAILPCHDGPRIRPTTELLFCMLRSKHNATNL